MPDAAEYFLGPKQVYDGGWIEHLGKDFKNGPESWKSMKDVVEAIIVSNTFSESSPDQGTCYDFAPGHQDNGLPCQISHVIRESCAGCHSYSYSPAMTHLEEGAGVINLSKWLPEQGMFEHIVDGQQLEKTASFQRIIDRLNSSDPDKRMPKNQPMADSDRSVLYDWFNSNK